MVEGLERVARTAARRGVNLAIHTHVNHANSLTPLVARAAQTALEVGVRDVRNQGVLMRGVNATAADLLDLCFALQGEAGILPYYFYMCDMIPNAEHWRVAVWQAQQLQHDIMGYLPGYATPRIVCDVPFVGKRWVHMVTEYDRERGITYWTKNYRTVDRGRRRGGAGPAVPVLRPDRHAARRRAAVVAQGDRRRRLTIRAARPGPWRRRAGSPRTARCG